MPDAVRSAMHRLAELLGRENEALRAMDPRRATAMLTEKTAAMAALTQAWDGVEVGPGMPGPVSSGLTEAARRLDALAAENRLLLERALAAQQRVIGIIAHAAASAGAAPCYHSGARGRHKPVTPPLSLSTRA